jgi:hypothetical protein
MKTIKTTLALLLMATVILGTLNLASATPGGNGTTGNSTVSPTPVPVVAQPADIVLVANNVPVAIIEALRQSIVTNPAFAFPAGQEGHAVKSINVIVSGNKATARIVLSAAAN